MTLLGTILTAVAMLILIIAAIGVLRLPDPLSRQHAATKAATLGVVVFSVGLAMIAIGEGWGWSWVVRLGLMVVVLLATLPLASHAVARAACEESDRMATGRTADVMRRRER
jgi:multicomponent Na+:H+ antiporter subunit G